MTSEPRAKPRRAWPWFLAAALCAVPSVALLVVPIRGGLEINAHVEAMPRLQSPGSIRVDLPEPGLRVLFHESRSVVDGVRVRGPIGVGPPACTVLDPNGRAVKLAQPRNQAEYDIGGFHGTSLAYFNATVPGTYTIDATTPVGDRPGAVVAVGSDPREAIGGILVLVACGCGGGLGIAVGVGLAIVGIVMLALRPA